MEISVIVPTFNRREMVKRTVETLFHQSYPPACYEIVIVVDGSDDGTSEAIRGLNAPCQLRVIEQENRGLASARNAGARGAEANLLLFLDDDMLCVPELLEAHVAAHKDDPRTIGFGCIFLSPDSPRSLAAECFNRELGAFYLKQKHSTVAPKPEEIECVFGNSSISRDLLMEVGGFDERFKMREDLELGVRLFRQGARSVYVERAVAYQYYAKTHADLIRDAEAFAIADVRFGQEHPDAWTTGHLSSLGRAPRWKLTLRRIAAMSPEATDLALSPACGLGELLLDVPFFCNLGVRALQIRRRIHWLHKAMALGRSG